MSASASKGQTNLHGVEHNGDGSRWEGKDPSIPPSDGRCLLLDMPGEILSQIASYLPLPNIIRLLSLHPLLLSLTQSHYSPIPSSVRSILSTPPYPTALSVLPHLAHYLPPGPDDSRRLFVQILVRARPKWIIERFELLRWDDRFWEEAFERRFLPSWKRFKGEDDNWRAAFLRVLGRIEHRQSGCTHEEAWTRFVTLHRNGSASINRIYSRTFDPFEIYDELKNQNNFSTHPTTVRVILHLQDVRILAVGVLIDQPSLFVNPNAHLTLHPPLLRHLSAPPDDSGAMHHSRWFRSSEEARGKKRRTPSAAVEENEAYFPLLPSSPQAQPPLSSSSAVSPSAGPIPIPLTIDSTASPPISPSAGSFGRILGNYMPGRRRSSTTTQSQQNDGTPVQGLNPAASGSGSGSGSGGGLSHSLGNLGGVLTAVRSRDSDDGRRRTWSFGRNRSGSTSNANSNTNQGDLFRTSSNLPGPSTAAPTDLPALKEAPSHSQDREANSGTCPADFQSQSQSRSLPDTLGQLVTDRPYDILERPQPALSHSRYPNFTPPPATPSSSTSSTTTESGSASAAATKDLRGSHPEIEDEYEGGLWGGDVSWGQDNKRMAEWDEDIGKRRRWVGPMLLIAQLHPSHRQDPHPPGVNPALPLEGPNPTLGQNGMYASLGFEDLEALFPWVQLKGSGGNSGEAKRSGLGF
ncbi:uncharacterized protein I303_108494 [Kwoniella dejecticola CBS 10117]|uniref:F-box domain-containing protein n=1 Tax=Kwoniella dejecticola CBS 10117 TaxID=1296121 RepID=A0A1A5ZX84_9TREE|nr:uncharacterized protein I303_07182 [Kwoniella dejecticola CBS 10117]OBR82423.1 hypothetical protein I303_07182 [Kwoniella dejecticola CBS 10117]